MNVKLLIAGLVVLALGGVAFAGKYGTNLMAPVSQNTFSDGTTLEVIEYANSAGVRSQAVQIKQGDGTVCYGIANQANNAPAMSCVK